MIRTDSAGPSRLTETVESETSHHLDVSTPLTPAPDHLLSPYLFCRGAEEIRELLDSPIVSLLDSRVIRGSGDMVTEGVKGELLASAGRES